MDIIDDRLPQLLSDIIDDSNYNATTTLTIIDIIDDSATTTLTIIDIIDDSATTTLTIIDIIDVVLPQISLISLMTSADHNSY